MSSSASVKLGWLCVPWLQQIADFDTAFKLNPKNARALYGRGLAKQKKGDNVGASADIAAAKAIDAGIINVFAKYGVL